MTGESSKDKEVAETEAGAENATPAGEPAFRPRGAGEILKGLWKDRSPSTSAKDTVNKLTQRELMLGWIAIVLAVTLTVVTYMSEHDATALKTRQAAPDLAVAGGIFALIILAGLLIRRRAMLGFGALMTGMDLISAGDILGALFLGFGGWIIMRWMNLSRQAQAGRRGQAPAKREVAKRQEPPRPPGKSKRYTPPRRRASSKSR